ncbi:2408_t:CDS:2, partial [Racocetra persica]
MSLRNKNITKKAHIGNKKVRHNWSIREKLMKQELLNSTSYLLTLNRDRPAQYLLLERRAKQLVQINEIKDAYLNIRDDFKFSN